MLATYVRHMRNNNLEIRIAGSSMTPAMRKDTNEVEPARCKAKVIRKDTLRI